MTADSIDPDLIEEAYQRSLVVLRRNLTPLGYRAAPDTSVNYNAVWGRDGSITAIAAFETGDQELIEGGIRTLISLAEHQASNGQIPSYLLLREEGGLAEVVHGGLGNVTSIDSNMWFVIACQAAVERLDRREFLSNHFRDVYRRTIRHLQSIDCDAHGLIEIPAAGDWTDLLDRSYHIFYDQVLWWRLLVGAAKLFSWCASQQEAEAMQRHADVVEKLLNEQFWWDRESMERARKNYFILTEIEFDHDLEYYQSHLQPFENHWYHRFAAFANVLGALSGLAPPDRVEKIIEQVQTRGLDRPAPLRVLDPVMRPGDPDWLAIYEKRQPAYEYHNGGIWPVAGGFWISLLAAAGRREEAREALTRLARVLRLAARKDEEWGFHEYLHGQTGQPRGREQQTWSAAGYIFGYQAAEHDNFACFPRRLSA